MIPTDDDDLQAAYFLAHRFVDPMRAAGRPINDVIAKYTRKIDLSWQRSADGPENVGRSEALEQASCNTAEAARIIRVTQRQARRLAEKGDLEGQKFGTVWVLSRQSVNDYAEAKRNGRTRPGS